MQKNPEFSELINTEIKSNITSQIVWPLIDWFADNARQLPWRDNPEPYYVWISEIMLQQTRVEAVKGYFERFTKELPDIASLASVEEERLLKLWEGLGYYNRAKNLKKAAIIIMEKYNGKLPKDSVELQKLPGIGAYTAGAISSIAYNKIAAAVDGNVLRVMMRLWGSFEDITKESVKKSVGTELERVIPAQYPGSFNQSLMELGATVCLPNGKPLCGECPIVKWCIAHQNNTQLMLPVKPPKKSRKIEEKTILVIDTSYGILIRKRPEKGLLASLWEYPSLDGKLDFEEVKKQISSAGLFVEEIQQLGEAKHLFSHIEWHMIGYYIKTAAKDINFCCAVAEEDTNNVSFLADCFPVAPQKLLKEYSIPAALDAYKKILTNFISSDKKHELYGINNTKGYEQSEKNSIE